MAEKKTTKSKRNTGNSGKKARRSKVNSIAEKYGLQDDYIFTTTLKRYEEQLWLMEDLQDDIEKNGTTIEKEYVKGRPNICPNPSVEQYNKTATAANQTATTLERILQRTFASKPAEEKDELLAALGIEK